MMEQNKMSLGVGSLRSGPVGERFYPLDNVLSNKLSASAVNTDFLSAYTKFLTNEDSEENSSKPEDLLRKSDKSCGHLNTDKAEPSDDCVDQIQSSVPFLESVKIDERNLSVQIPKSVDVDETVKSALVSESENSVSSRSCTEEIEETPVITPVNIAPVSETYVNEEKKTLLREVKIQIERLSPESLNVINTPQPPACNSNHAVFDYISHYNIRPCYILLEKLPLNVTETVRNNSPTGARLPNYSNTNTLDNNKENEQTSKLSELGDSSTKPMKSDNTQLSNVLTIQSQANIEEKSNGQQQGTIPTNSKLLLADRARTDKQSNGKGKKESKEGVEITKQQHKSRVSPKTSITEQNKQTTEQYGNVPNDCDIKKFEQNKIPNHKFIKPVTEKLGKRKYVRRKDVNDTKNNNECTISNIKPKDNTFQTFECLKKGKRGRPKSTNNDRIGVAASTQDKYNSDNTFHKVRKYVRKEKKVLDNTYVNADYQQSSIFHKSNKLYSASSKHPKKNEFTIQQRFGGVTDSSFKMVNNFNKNIEKCGNVYSDGRFNDHYLPNMNKSRCKKQKHFQIFKAEEDTFRIFPENPTIASIADHNYTKELYTHKSNKPLYNNNQQYSSVNFIDYPYCASNNKPMFENGASGSWSDYGDSSNDDFTYNCKAYNKNANSNSQQYAIVMNSFMEDYTFDSRRNRGKKSKKNIPKFPEDSSTTEKIYQPLSLASIAVKTFFGL